MITKYQNDKLISLYYNVPFIFECLMTNKTPSSMKRHCKSTEPERHQMPKVSFVLSFFRWDSSKLHDSLPVVFVPNSSSAWSHCFFTTSTHKEPDQELWLHLWHHFLLFYSTHYSRITNLEIIVSVHGIYLQTLGWVCRYYRSLISCW